jgi:hypothetical protein
VRLITATDDELYGLASAAGKLGRSDKLLARLAAARRADPADAEAAGRHALALMAVLPSLGAGGAAHVRFTGTIDAFGDVLALEPDHWLACYSRARLRTLIPSTYGAYSVDMSAGLGHAREDLDHLFAAQAEHAGQPYFVSTHALAAVVDHLGGSPAPAVRPALLDALAACPRVPVRFPALGAILCEPLATLYAAAQGAERHAIGEVMSALYGDQPAVAAVRRQPVRR